MRWLRFNGMVGALALSAAMLAPAGLSGQSSQANSSNVKVTIAVEDSQGAAIAGAVIEDANGKLIGHTDASGRLTISCAVVCNLRVSAVGFAEKTARLTGDATIRLEPAAAAEQVTVTAYRAPLGSLESPATTRLLTQADLSTTASITLDGEMRRLPGVELFRRSSSLVANPSSQGMSLRGLGSTSASRTLLTEDDVPLNDAFARNDSLAGAAGAGDRTNRVGARRGQRSVWIERHRRRGERGSDAATLPTRWS